MNKYDVVIIGAGLVGGISAIALSGLGYKVGIIDDSFPNMPEGKLPEYGLALSYGSVAFLRELGIWMHLQDIAAAIKEVHVSEIKAFPKVRMRAADSGVEALGYVINAKSLSRKIDGLLRDANVTPLGPARLTGLSAEQDEGPIYLSYESLLDKGPQHCYSELVLGADGAKSTVRQLLGIELSEKRFNQTALIAPLVHEFSHEGRAFERFTGYGAIAILPAVGQSNSWLIWTINNEQASSFKSEPASKLIQYAQKTFGNWLGDLALAGDVLPIPLAERMPDRLIHGRTILIGNAAHQLHPVAGQGLNLGISDIRSLYQLLQFSLVHGVAIPSVNTFMGYARDRQRDHKRTAMATSGLVELFSRDFGVLNPIRRKGLLLAQNLPFARKLLSEAGMRIK